MYRSLGGNEILRSQKKELTRKLCAKCCKPRQNKEGNRETNDEFNYMLQLILSKLDRQEALIVTFEDRLKKQEYRSNGVIHKTKEKCVACLGFWHEVSIDFHKMKRN